MNVEKNQLNIKIASRNTFTEMKTSQMENPNVTTSKDLKLVELQGNDIPISQEQLIKAIDRAVKAVQGPYTSLEFSVHETTKRISVKVMNRDTGEVIREIPPEKSLDLVAKLWEMAGILIDERR
jgi:flagellar protein FlaG